MSHTVNKHYNLCYTPHSKKKVLYLIVVSSKVGDEADMFGANGLDSSLNGHCCPLLHVLRGTCPLGGVIVRQLSHPVSKSDLDISVQWSHW